MTPREYVKTVALLKAYVATIVTLTPDGQDTMCCGISGRQMVNAIQTTIDVLEMDIEILMNDQHELD